MTGKKEKKKRGVCSINKQRNSVSFKLILFPFSFRNTSPTYPNQDKNRNAAKHAPSSSPFCDIPERPAGSDDSSSRGRAGSALDFSGAQTSYDSPFPAPAPPLSWPQVLLPPTAPGVQVAGGPPRGVRESRGRYTCGRRGAGPRRPSARSSPAAPLGVSLGCRAGWTGSADSPGSEPRRRAPAPSVSSAAVRESTRSSAIAGATRNGDVGGGGTGRARARQIPLEQQRTRCPAQGRDAVRFDTGPAGRLDGSGAGGGCRASEWEGHGGEPIPPSLQSRGAGGSRGESSCLGAQRPRSRAPRASPPPALPCPGDARSGPRAGSGPGVRLPGRRQSGARKGGGDPELRPCVPAGGWKLGRRGTSRWGGGGGSTWGETENAGSLDSVPKS